LHCNHLFHWRRICQDGCRGLLRHPHRWKFGHGRSGLQVAGQLLQPLHTGLSLLGDRRSGHRRYFWFVGEKLRPGDDPRRDALLWLSLGKIVEPAENLFIIDVACGGAGDGGD